eukprot:CAMPEP_0202865952 /NCGR_PEP_ID=MMETSP1391-20130828/6772_1 /ASSEMBLY_ACC=CAM_ASM_000867 /TAXON_ID=1034604 /ORGANISM="Chlamydomonas leiostraca, Strain SAG 11-49" /LENGTH=71 /DNA_ID=CAMNT_0049545843 /DNA_START=1101 /DNA_END=1316 /DNA_ORIENTATION=+
MAHALTVWCMPAAGSMLGHSSSNSCGGGGGWVGWCAYKLVGWRRDGAAATDSVAMTHICPSVVLVGDALYK